MEDAQGNCVDQQDGGDNDVGHDAGPDGSARGPFHDSTQSEGTQEPQRPRYREHHHEQVQGWRTNHRPRWGARSNFTM